MTQHIPAAHRYHHKMGWLNTYHLFSFANYYDPANVQFGTLRVFNDDRIDAYYGFDEHAHANMEIVTIMLEGELTHRDDMGNVKTIRAGEVQHMSAGKGVIHAEKNLAGDPVHLYQLWFLPRRNGIAPSYSQEDFSYRIAEHGLTPVASGESKEGALNMYADATVSIGRCLAAKEVTINLEEKRGLFIYLTRGEVVVQGQVMQAGDQVRITDESAVSIRASQNAEFIAIDVSTLA